MIRCIPTRMLYWEHAWAVFGIEPVGIDKRWDVWVFKMPNSPRSRLMRKWFCYR